MESIDIDFDGSSSQVSSWGPAHAVPGALAGLVLTVGTAPPWQRLLRPAVALAREVELTLNRPTCTRSSICSSTTPKGARSRRRTRASRSGRIVMRNLGALELLADGGAHELYRGELGRAVVSYLEQNGGLITEHDLSEYRVIWRRPIRVPRGDVRLQPSALVGRDPDRVRTTAPRRARRAGRARKLRRVPLSSK